MRPSRWDVGEASPLFLDLALHLLPVSLDAIPVHFNLPEYVDVSRATIDDPMTASSGLIGLSNAYDSYGESKAFQRKKIETALRINS